MVVFFFFLKTAEHTTMQSYNCPNCSWCKTTHAKVVTEFKDTGFVSSLYYQEPQLSETPQRKFVQCEQNIPKRLKIYLICQFCTSSTHLPFFFFLIWWTYAFNFMPNTKHLLFQYIIPYIPALSIPLSFLLTPVSHFRISILPIGGQNLGSKFRV